MSNKADQNHASLYAKREKIYPREVHGLFAFWRASGAIILLGIFYITPLIQWSGRQAILFDLPNRKFYLFDLIFWPQDFIYLALLLIISAVTLFFFTAIAGRLWCGFACPQTVWTEVFLWIERKVEGTRQQQIKLDKEAWTAKKIGLKSTKHTIWILFSLYTGFTFVGYFTPINELAIEMYSWDFGPWETFWILFYGFATYGNAGWMREQVCIYMCPYARFQSAMFDNDTLVIAYDNKRGEPRGSRNKKVDIKELDLGSCIDCELCVQVCPTGIDIRNGLQYECIACGCCIDVCNDVMDKMEYPPKLIQYTTENTVNKTESKILRPRIVIYILVLLLLLTVFFVAISKRLVVELDVMRDRKILYRETSEGLIENIYIIQVLNKDKRPHQIRIKVSGLKYETLNIKNKLFTVPSGEILEIPTSIQMDPSLLKSSRTRIEFRIESVSTGKLGAVQDSRFIAP